MTSSPSVVPSFEELLNSRPLDVHRWSDFPEVNEFVNEVYLLLTSITGHENSNKKLLKVLLLDLYVAWSADPKLMVIFSRNNNSHKALTRYNKIHVGKKIIDIVDVLVAEKIIHEKRGFNDRVRGSSFDTRIWASEWLQKKFKKARFHQFMVHPYEDREPIILRDTSKVALEYTDTTETVRMRSILRNYNELLSKTHIDIYDLEVPVLEVGEVKRKMCLQINQQDKFVRRIFNNERWDQGGRFYGGWWQRCPKEFRKKIMIDGFRTAEVDFSGLHIVILYAQRGINYWAEVNEDPYELHGVNNIDPDIDLRTVAKLLLLTAINADNESMTFQAFRSQAEAGSLAKRLTNEQLSSVLSALKRKHEPIADKLASGVGIDLMYIDSQITELLIERFMTEYKCPILTVHDSYIVPYGYDRFLEKEMQIAFEKVTGVTQPVVKHVTEYFDLIEIEPDPDEPEPEDDKVAFDQYAAPASKRHLKELEAFRKFKEKPLLVEEPWFPNWSSVF